MATKKNTEQTTEDVIDVTSFFSREIEETGAWFEPIVSGIHSGIEFKIYGPNSTAVTMADEAFQKAKDEIDNDANKENEDKRRTEILTKRLAAYVADIRGKGGKKLVINDKEVTKDDVYDILFNSPSLALEVNRFSMRVDNFLKMKN